MAKPLEPLILGVDGCRGGWLVARLIGSDSASFEWLPLSEIGSYLATCRAARSSRQVAVAIDMPIGLPAVGQRRACDALARSRLPGRASTIFPAPPREVLSTPSYATARSSLSAAGGPSISAQTWGIVPAIRSLDAAITPDDELWLFEAHPELAFASMTGAPLPPKTTKHGRQQRRDALRTLGTFVHPEIDSLDALACAWVASRHLAGETEELTDGTRDARGLLMRIVRST